MNKGVSFMDNDGLTQYMRIAISVAERIAAGELREGEKISGRSKLSSEYEVSPETVRRAIQLLSDMRVVAVKEQSGVYVLSADNAKRYLQNFENRAALANTYPQWGQESLKTGITFPHLSHFLKSGLRQFLQELAFIASASDSNSLTDPQ